MDKMENVICHFTLLKSETEYKWKTTDHEGVLMLFKVYLNDFESSSLNMTA